MVGMTENISLGEGALGEALRNYLGFVKLLHGMVFQSFSMLNQINFTVGALPYHLNKGEIIDWGLLRDTVMLLGVIGYAPYWFRMRRLLGWWIGMFILALKQLLVWITGIELGFSRLEFVCETFTFVTYNVTHLDVCLGGGGVMMVLLDIFLKIEKTSIYCIFFGRKKIYLDKRFSLFVCVSSSISLSICVYIYKKMFVFAKVWIFLSDKMQYSNHISWCRCRKFLWWSWEIINLYSGVYEILMALNLE